MGWTVGFFTIITGGVLLPAGFWGFLRMVWRRGGGFFLFLRAESLGSWCTGLRRGCSIPFPGARPNIRAGRNCTRILGACWAGLRAWLCSIRLRIIFPTLGWWTRGLWSWFASWDRKSRVRLTWFKFLKRLGRRNSLPRISRLERLWIASLAGRLRGRGKLFARER